MTKIDKKIINDLSELMEINNLSELRFSDGKIQYELKKQILPSQTKNLPPTAKKESIQKNTNYDTDKSLKSPLVGTAYLSPEPGAKKFIEVGQNVKIGQILLIIEAMKTMNEITADKDGKIKKIFVRNETPVEFGEPLVLIE